MASLNRVSSFEEIQEVWQRLLPSCTTNTLFMTPAWQKVWWREFGEGSEMLLLYLDGGNGVEGIAPLHRRNGTISLIGDRDVCDYNDFLVSKGQEEAFYTTLLEYLQREEWETIRLFSLREDSATISHLPKLAESQGLEVTVEKEDVVPGLVLPGSWEEYLAGLSKKDRHELRRKLRRLSSAEGLRWYTLSVEADVQREMDAFLYLMRLSHHDKDRFLTSQRESFFRSMSEKLANKGLLKLSFMELGGKKVAAAMCFDYCNSRLLYNSGYDPAYSYYSVGLLLKALCLKDAIEQGQSYFDFLRGPEPYKYDLGGRDRLLYQMQLARR